MRSFLAEVDFFPSLSLESHRRLVTFHLRFWPKPVVNHETKFTFSYDYHLRPFPYTSFTAYKVKDMVHVLKYQDQPIKRKTCILFIWMVKKRLNSDVTFGG